MLRFQSPPDAVFLAILHYAIEATLDELEDEYTEEDYWKGSTAMPPKSSPCPSLETR